jgi:hypothetical protein
MIIMHDHASWTLLLLLAHRRDPADSKYLPLSAPL